MRVFHLRIFQKEVERQCRFALMAWQDLDAELAKTGSSAFDMYRVWYSLQSVLVAVANISKLLWPNPKDNKAIPERGEELRDSLSVTEPSPLQPRTFRNHFEHFDQRLECWATSLDGANFVDENIGPVEVMAPFGLPPKASLRNYDPQDETLTYRGEVYSLRPVIDAVRELCERAAEEAAKPIPRNS